MEELVVNLNGVLNVDLIQKLKETVQKHQLNKLKLVLDFSGLVSISLESKNVFFDFLELLRLQGTTYVGCSVPDFLRRSWDEFESESYIKLFSSRTTAQQYLNTFQIKCPNCLNKLKVSNIGNHICPSCEARFYVYPNLATREYEKLI